MKTHYLSQEEREYGTKHFMRWANLNGLGFNFLGDTIIYLMAIHFGASNVQLGYISAILHASGIILLIFPWLLAGKNLNSVFLYAWLARGLVCIGYGALFFLKGQAAVLLILVLYTIFCITRTFGVTASSPIQRMLATPQTMGKFVVTLSNRFQATRFISQLLSFTVLSIQQLSGIVGYLLLIAIGITANTLSSLSIKQIPCREVIEHRSGYNIFRIFVQSIRHRERALTLFLRWHALSLMVILSFIIPFLRKVAVLPSNVIFLYTLAGTVATMVAGYALRPFTDRIGSRPVLIMASFLLALTALIWCVIPITIDLVGFFFLGFVTFLLQSTVMLLVSRLELRSIPETNKMGYVSMLNFFSAAISLGMGLFGGFLADLGERIPFPGVHAFGLTFFVAVILAMQIGILSFFLKDAGSLSLRDTAQILFSTRNLKAFLDVYQFHSTEDQNRRKSILLSIGKSNTTVAVDEMRKILRNPLSTEKEDILKSLFVYPKPALLDDMIKEASDKHSYHRVTALFALGAYPNKKVEDVLLPLLRDRTSRVRSTAAKSLARVGNRSALPTIRKLSADPNLTIWDRMNYMIAMSFMDQEGRYLEQIFTMADHHQGTSYEQTILSLAAKMHNMSPPLSELYQEENVTPSAGLNILLEEAKQLQPFFTHAHHLTECYEQGRYEEIWQWCRDLLPDVQQQRFQYLKNAIKTYDFQKTTREKAFSALYFTYQILR
ncbi:hypothetical protein CSA56_03970 [candidate division KSB3 bacterium]|uniref:Uncharacterized protein n=1 Tax=candidate division KSB3 bacterium TaxID=2044937 RepID=A0A2G6KIM2_9BACT|nr:MAG: hypothetical protein CSA56_03970 [candidate division KSB3 bacterium]